MKKTGIQIVIIAFVAALMLSAFSACNNAPKLATPANAAANEQTQKLTWDEVANATGYKVSVDGKESKKQSETSYSLSSLAAGGHTLKVKAIGDGKQYQDSNWSSLISYAVIADSAEAISLTGYQIIYPKDSTGMERYAAEFLSDYIKNTADITVAFTDDAADETQKEILIGETNRAASASAAGLTYAADDVLIQDAQDKIVLYGNDLMIAGAVGQFASKFVKANGKAVNLSKSALVTKYETKSTSENVIIMMGDGMGFNHIAAAKANKPTFEFFAEYLPNQGESKTNSFPKLGTALTPTPTTITDSTTGATSLACGIKTRYNHAGLDKNENSVKNAVELGHEKGYKTAVVTTDAAHGASPAGFTVHIDDRYKFDAIKAQQKTLVDSGTIDYLKGTGGRGELGDGKVGNPGTGGEDMYPFVQEALWLLRGDGTNNYFAFFEEDDIDNYSHKGNLPKFRDMVERLNRSVGYVLTFTLAHPGTAFILTADHETGGITKNATTGLYGFTTSGYSHSGANVPVYAFGVGAEEFNNTAVENNEIGQYIAHIMGEDNFNGNVGNRWVA